MTRYASNLAAAVAALMIATSLWIPAVSIPHSAPVAVLVA
jgi:hypothetical protein